MKILQDLKAMVLKIARSNISITAQSLSHQLNEYTFLKNIKM